MDEFKWSLERQGVEAFTEPNWLTAGSNSGIYEHGKEPLGQCGEFIEYPSNNQFKKFSANYGYVLNRFLSEYIILLYCTVLTIYEQFQKDCEL